MGNDGLPVALAVVVSTVVLGALGFVAWIATKVIEMALTAPAD